MTKASVNEFDANYGKMPATRKLVTSVGPYILELYKGGILEMGTDTTAVEVYKKQSGGSYTSKASLKFEEESEAREVYNDMKTSSENVKTHI